MSERDPPRPDLFQRIPPRPDHVPVQPVSHDVSRLSLRPKATWKAWEAIAVYVLAFLGGGLATLPILELIEDDDLATFTASAVAAVVVTGSIIAWLWKTHPRWRDVIGFPPRGEWWSEVRSSIGFGLVLYPTMVFGVGLVLALILGVLSGEAVEAPEQVPSEPSTITAIITVMYAIVIAPVHEELYFRGVLFRAVRDRYGLTRGLLATGIGFALVHFLEAEWQDTLLLMAVMFINGMALAWWYERRGTIVASLVAHMVFNVIGLTLILTLR
jgi:membrane protease YdiL (CAAX protease family)